MSTIINTDLFLVTRAGTNYQVTGADVATFALLSGLPSQGGNTGKVLSTNGSNVLSWITVGGTGTVTSVDVSGGTTGLTYSGGPVTASGTITMAGVLGVANGGTGQTTTQAAIDALLPTQTGNSGKYLTTNGSVTAWSATPLNGAASLAEAAAGTITDKYSSPQTAVPKDASGMAGAALIPGGNNAARPGTPVTGMFRYNSQAGTPVSIEYYDGAAWSPVGSTAGLGLVLDASALKVSLPVASTPPTVGGAAAQAVNGSIYWDDTLGQLFIRYINGGTPVWVAAAPPGGGSSLTAATLVQAAAGTLNTVFSSPQTSVPKDASGMTGAAILPAGTSAQQPATPVAGMTRLNTDTKTLEFYDGTAWVSTPRSFGDPQGWFGHSSTPS